MSVYVLSDLFGTVSTQTASPAPTIAIPATITPTASLATSKPISECSTQLPKGALLSADTLITI